MKKELMRKIRKNDDNGPRTLVTCVNLSPIECNPTYFSQATQYSSSVGNGFTEYKGKKEDILACFGEMEKIVIH